MSSSERRRATRLLLEVPAQILTADGALDATTEDVSRTGVGLRVLTTALGFQPSLDLGRAVAAVRAALPGSVDLRLRHPVLPTALERSGLITRIAIPLDAPACVELGVHFEASLTDAEASALGVTLPAVREDVAPVRAAARERSSGFATAAKQAYRAYLTSSAPGAPPSLLCQSDHLSRDAVRVRVPRAGKTVFAGASVADVTLEFADRFGTRLGLKLMRASHHLWTGPVRVCAVDLPPERQGDMLVTLAFERRLRPAELRRLGLEQGVA